MTKPQDKKGMTLVELIIAVAITAIVITAACTMLYLGGNFFRSGTASASNQQKAALAESYIQRYAATAFRLSPAKITDADGVAFTLSNHVLHIDQQTVKSGETSQKEIASVDGIGQVHFQADGKLLSYQIISQDGTYTLSGGTVMNNSVGDEADLTGEADGFLFMDLTAPADSD